MNTRKPRKMRVPYDKELVLRLDDGQVISGRATNISNSGFCMVVGSFSQSQQLEGKSATLLVDLDVESFELACRVVRIDQSGLAVQFIE